MNKETYYASLIKILYYADNKIKPVGVGVLIAEDTILTCAHVVADALGSEGDATRKELGADSSVWVHRVFIDGVSDIQSSLVECEIIEYFSRNNTNTITDLAILKTKEKARYLIDGDLKVSCFSKKIPKDKDQISVFGFPLDASEIIGQAIEASYHIIGKMPNHWLNALANKAYGDEIRRGFSGSPAINSNKEIIGIICEADEERRTATIIPVSILSKITTLQFCQVKQDSKDSINNNQPIPFFEKNNSAGRIFLDWLSPSIHYFLTVKLGLLADPPERLALEKHLREQQAEWSQELIGKTFLPPPAKEMPILPAQIISGNKKFYTPIQQLIKEVVGFSSGGDGASAQIAALSKKSKRVRNLVKRLKYSETPLIVLGDPGSGKTITLKQVAIDLCLENSRRVFPSLCLFVHLGRWKPVKKPSIEDVEILVEEAAGPYLTSILLELSKRQRLIIIFDGLDEMSRLNYNEHTKALSQYAERYNGLIKTLFSCRIADFSPTFKHNRLVLLPFQRNHISNYLIRQFGKTKLEVSGELISIKKLGKRLITQKLPIQPQNPFSLWLLSLYLREKQCWPETRTKLLAFLFDYQYQRKLDEAKISKKDLPDKEQLFSDLGQLALSITQQNRGTDIAVYNVMALFGQRTNLLIETGRMCGVLQQSLNDNTPLIRFEHQRAQEYFTAYAIVKTKIKIDWTKLLEQPRWQETLVNIAQMDVESTPLSVLRENLIITNNDKLDSIDTALRESQYAEQVELATRVLAAVPRSKEAINLENETSNVSGWLSEKGNPTSQVKMLRLTHRLPAQDARFVIDKALDSNVRWVKNQALEVAASISSDVSTSPLPIEVANAYGDGSIIRIIPSRLKIAYKTGSKGLAFVSLLSLFLFLFHIVVISVAVEEISLAIANDVTNTLYYKNLLFIAKKVKEGELPKAKAIIKLLKLLENKTLYKNWISILIPMAIILAIIGSLIWFPQYFWIIIPASGFGLVLLLSLIYSFWLYAPYATIGSIFGNIWNIWVFTGACIIIIIMSSFILFLFSTLIAFIFITILSISIYIWSGKPSHLFSTYKIIYRNNGFIEYIEIFGGSWLFLIIVILIVKLKLKYLLVIIYGYIVNTLSDLLSNTDYWWVRIFININDIVPDISFLNRFFDYIFVGLLIFLIIKLLNFILTLVFFKEKNPNLEEIIIIIIYLIFIFISSKIIWYFDVIKSSTYSIAWLIKGIMFMLILISIGILIALIYWIWKKYIPYIKYIKMDLNNFKYIIKYKNTNEQAQILRSLNFNELNISTSEFYSLLIELESYIKEEPALSEYYQKRDELEDILRQEKHN